MVNDESLIYMSILRPFHLVIHCFGANRVNSVANRNHVVVRYFTFQGAFNRSRIVLASYYYGSGI